jgi:hypothetical protein
MELKTDILKRVVCQQEQTPPCRRGRAVHIHLNNLWKLNLRDNKR